MDQPKIPCVVHLSVSAPSGKKAPVDLTDLESVRRSAAQLAPGGYTSISLWAVAGRLPVEMMEDMLWTDMTEELAAVPPGGRPHLSITEAPTGGQASTSISDLESVIKKAVKATSSHMSTSFINALRRCGIVNKHMSLSGVSTDQWDYLQRSIQVQLSLRRPSLHSFHALPPLQLPDVFEWNSDMNETSQRELPDGKGYLAHVELLIGEVPHIYLVPDDEGAKLLSDLGFLDLPLCGKTDLMFVDGSKKPVLHAIRCLKKIVEHRHLIQAYLQLLVVNTLSRHLRPFLFLTDLNQSWRLMYMDGNSLFELELERQVAVALIKHVLHEEQPDARCRLQPSQQAGDDDPFFKRQEMLLAGPASAPDARDEEGVSPSGEEEDDDRAGGEEPGARGHGGHGESSEPAPEPESPSNKSPDAKRCKTSSDNKDGIHHKLTRQLSHDVANMADLTGLLGSSDAYDAQVNIVLSYFNREIAPMYGA